MFRLDAITSMYPTVVTIRGETDAYDKDNSLITLDEALITTEVTRLQTAYDALQYQRDRKVEYDKLNQLALISDDSINGTTIHKDAILAIKAMYPKPI